MYMNQSGAAVATLEDLLSCHDERFIRNAYHVLLGRAPDPEGMQYYLARIRIGISKVEILAQLLLSKEGKSRLVTIAGLNEAISRHKLLRLPLLGRLLRLVGTEQQERNSHFWEAVSSPSFSERYKAFQKGETEVSKKLAQGYLRFHLDTPDIGLVNIVKDSCVVSGWAVDLERHLAVKVRIVVGQTTHGTTSRQREDVQREFTHLCELPLSTGFTCALKLPLGVHRMRIEVEGIDGSWIPVRSTVLIRVPGRTRVQSRKPKLSYKEWASLDLQQLNMDIPNINHEIVEMVLKPTFTVIVDTRQGQSGLQDTIQSIRTQLYPCRELRVISDAASPQLPDDVTLLKDMSLAGIRGKFVIFLQSGQLLARNALFEFSLAINRQPDVDLIYGDHDSITAGEGRSDPFHKPGWSPDYLETFNYIGFTACFRTSVARGRFDNTHLYDLALRFTERTTRILHIAKILGHNSKSYWFANTESAKTVAHNIAALSDRLARTGRRGFVSENELHKGCYDIRIELERTPLVSIVIPTAGKTVTVEDRRIDLIVNVIRQIRNISTYKNVEIIVVDNGDLSPAQLSFLSDAQCKLITYTNPVFNIAKKLNLGASLANGEFLLLMNDDIEILTPTWIERLLEHFEKPHVGVVGAKLVYPNKEIQHAGVVQPFGNPDHVRRSFARDDPGYFYSTCGVRNFSAITGAVMMSKTSIYREVGGYTDELAVCFNDVDFCMKVGRKGLSVVYTPRAELIHMESLSRIVELDMEELAWFHKRWSTELVSDQFYNDRFLTVEPPTFIPCVN
jgi:GT2 family glycosyltransferase